MRRELPTSLPKRGDERGFSTDREQLERSTRYTVNTKIENQPMNPQMWAKLVDIFKEVERRWAENWGATPITFHEIINRPNKHSLVPIEPVAHQRCDACGAPGASFACPRPMAPIQCQLQHFACAACHARGFDVHYGFLGGLDRHYNLIVLKYLFRVADVDKSGALDFLEFMYALIEAARRLPWYSSETFWYSSQQVSA